jgi:hypothetical protein
MPVLGLQAGIEDWDPLGPAGYAGPHPPPAFRTSTNNDGSERGWNPVRPTFCRETFEESTASLPSRG